MATKSLIIRIEDEHGDEQPVEIVIKSANKSDGIRRAELIMGSFEMNEGQLRKQAAFWLYPTCVASVRSPDSVRDMTFDDFMTKINEADIDEWLKIAYELNPQWRNSLKALSEMTPDEEKKTTTSSDGSSQPTET